MIDSKDVVLFSTADWDTPYWTNKQHTARHLAREGYRVLYVESVGLRPPTLSGRDLSRIWHRFRRGLRPIRAVEAGIWILPPLAIPMKQHWPLVRRINQGWMRLRIRRFVRQETFRRPMIWTYHPFMRESISGIPHGPVVYHCVDDIAAIPGVNAAAFNSEERSLLLDCQVVFVTSKALEEKCRQINPNTHYFPNVVDLDHFMRAHEDGPLPQDLSDIPRPRIGYIGVLSDYKVDFSLIRNVALQKPNFHWVLIGEEREGQRSVWIERLRALPNVHFLGYKSYKDLPDYLRGIDVGTLPTLINGYTRSMFPMKYYEYVAAGVPVVSTALAFADGGIGHILAARDADEFATAIESQLKHESLSSEESVRCVGDNTWAARFNKMIDVVTLYQSREKH